MQNATIYVRFTNHIDLPSSIHWHGVRLANKFDGASGLTQDAVPPGGTFVYQVHFPDAGLYWYHPHVREDIEQNLGLFGNAVVDSPDPHYYNPVNAEAVLMLDDLLVDKQGIIPYGKDAADFTIMGRFGNVLLVNGEPNYHLAVHNGRRRPVLPDGCVERPQLQPQSSAVRRSSWWRPISVATSASRWSATS